MRGGLNNIAAWCLELPALYYQYKELLLLQGIQAKIPGQHNKLILVLKMVEEACLICLITSIVSMRLEVVGATSLELFFQGKFKGKRPSIIVISSPSTLILPFLASSKRIGSKRAYLIPAHLLNLLRSIFPPLLESIHKTRSRGDCEGPSLFIA